jgi:sporulation protein YlmC with PRC-barrel domain
MNRKLQTPAIVAAAGLMAWAALAQEAFKTKTGGTEMAPNRSTSAMRKELLGRVEKVSDLLGMEVKNYKDERLGKVDEFTVDLETGRIVQVILSTGGFRGLGVKRVPVAPGALCHDAATKFIQLHSDKSKLKAAPQFGMSNWAGLGNSNQVAATYRYAGQEPYFAARYPSDVGADPTARLGYVQRATRLLGVSVKNVQDDTLGKVDQLMVDLAAGRVVSVIVVSGGFLGIGQDFSAVPPAAFQFNSEHEYLQLDISKEALHKAPHFRSNSWPDFDDPIYTAGIYRTYGVEPYFTTNAVVAAVKPALTSRSIH